MFFATMLVFWPRSFRRFVTTSARTRCRCTSARRTLPYSSRSTSGATSSRSSLREPQRQPFRDDRHAERPAVRDALQQRRLQDVGDVRQPDLALGELLADDRDGRAGRLRDPERQVPRRPAHRDDEVPAFRRHGVGHQVAHQRGADVAGRLEPERRHPGRQRQVVVDRLRNVGDVQPAPGGAGGAGTIWVAPKAVSSPPIVTRASIFSSVSALSALCSRQSGSGADSSRTVGLARDVNRIEPPVWWMRDTSPMSSGWTCDAVALDQVRVPVQDPDHVPAGVPGLDGGGRDHGVHAGSRAPAAQDSQAHPPSDRAGRRDSTGVASGRCPPC